MPAGRPSSYRKKEADMICELLAMGKSLRQIAAIEGMPHETQIIRWVRDVPEFRKLYARARRRQARYYAEQMIDIADDVSNDVTGELGMPNSVAVQRAKLQIDTRKWIAAKLLPKKYGDVPAQNSTSVNVGLVLQHSIPQPKREEIVDASTTGYLDSGSSNPD